MDYMGITLRQNAIMSLVLLMADIPSRIQKILKGVLRSVPHGGSASHSRDDAYTSQPNVVCKYEEGMGPGKDLSSSLHFAGLDWSGPS